MDLHRCLHLVGIDEESLHSEILSLFYGARNLPSSCVKPTSDGSGRALHWSVVRSRYYRGIFVVRFDPAGEEGDLATWRAIPTKVCYSMVSWILKINGILPNPGAFSTNRRTIGRRYPFVFFMSIGMVPMSFWIWTTEMTLQVWPYYIWNKAGETGDFANGWINDTNLSFSFGQVCLR